ncbi:AMP-binding protein [Rhizomonospora bruguierae]|uniref:AMP-binding protein n=1 Tax=Rhizomonospora bruguierae TaxID=1581705 RepID=UPI0020C0E3BB|nr:AMP-binding protein [Micromonospora sp. NBRC 107566]
MDALLPALTGAFGDHPEAVRVGDRTLSWSQLADRAGTLAERLAGAPAVAVLATPTVDTVVAVVAGLLAGVPVVPVAPDAGPRERAHILADARPGLFFGAADPLPAPAPTPPDAALILYTSGTTGPPKGALIGPGAIAADLDALAGAWSWTAADTLVHGLPLYHVHGLVLGVLGALRIGSRLVHTGRPTPRAYASAGGTLYFGVPTVWGRVAADPPAARALRRARLLVSGSAALPGATCLALEELTGQRPIERYGMTETLITLSARADGARLAGAVGTPVTGIQTRVVDDTGAPLPPDSLGELEVRGPTLFNGYLNRPDATAAAHTADGWFRTGDVVTVDAAGVHRVVGRSSTDLIKSGGYRIGAGEVEEALLAHPAVRQAAVVGAPHPDLGQEIVAYVVADGVGESDLISYVAADLAVHKRPRRVRFLDDLPRNAMGKVQKRLLG